MIVDPPNGTGYTCVACRRNTVTAYGETCESCDASIALWDPDPELPVSSFDDSERGDSRRSRRSRSERCF